MRKVLFEKFSRIRDWRPAIRPRRNTTSNVSPVCEKSLPHVVPLLLGNVFDEAKRSAFITFSFCNLLVTVLSLVLCLFGIPACYRRERETTTVTAATREIVYIFICRRCRRHFMVLDPRIRNIIVGAASLFLSSKSNRCLLAFVFAALCV